MARPIRVFDGIFGRLQLIEAAADPAQAAGAPRIVVKHTGGDIAFAVDGEALPLTRENVLFLNPGVVCETRPAAGGPPAQLVVFEASSDWLRGRFPAVFESGVRPFPAASEAITQRIRQLVDTLAIEVLNDQFLSHERLEFMLQELTLSIVETYLARRQAASRLWRGSPFADLRIRRALALLRPLPPLDRPLAARVSRHAVRRVRDRQAFLGQRQDRRGVRGAGLLGAIQLHALLPAAGRHPALRVPARRVAAGIRRNAAAGPRTAQLSGAPASRVARPRGQSRAPCLKRQRPSNSTWTCSSAA